MEDAKKLAQELTAFCMNQTNTLQTSLNTPVGKAVFSIALGFVLTLSGDSDIERCVGTGNCWEQ